MKVKLFDDLIERKVETEVLEGVFSEICNLFDKIEELNGELLVKVDEDSQSKLLNSIIDIQRIKCDGHSKLIAFKNNEGKVRQGDNSCNVLIKKVGPLIYNGGVRTSFPHL